MAAKSSSSKVRTVFRCAECGASAAKWAGRCTTCGAWNTMAEEIDSPPSARFDRPVLAPTSPATPIDQVSTEGFAAVPTGIAELDRVLGGGLVPGSVTLLGGEPGIGKSTLLLQFLGAVAKSGRRALLVSGEESRSQVHLRATRLDAIHPNMWLAAETSLPEIIGQIDAVGPEVVVVDSIQTLHDPELSSAPGSVGQVRECSHALVRIAKEQGISILLVGHVTKEGSLAGPRVLEHIVDTVLAFEGDRHHALRLLRAVKHRFGATGELGLFEMLEGGLVGVADPSNLFLGDRHHGASGSVVTCALEGARPLLVETQALVTESSLSFPRRAATGLDSNRLAVLLAVLEQRAGINKLAFCDVYAAAVGGVRLVEPAVDLPVCLAMASAYCEVPFPDDAIAIGEVGLAGEIRSVSQIARRLGEAARLGFKRAIVPKSTPDVNGIQLIRVATLFEAVDQLGFRVASTKGAFKAQGGSGGGSGGGAGGGRTSSRGASNSNANSPDSNDGDATPTSRTFGSKRSSESERAGRNFYDVNRDARETPSDDW
jgi:DNA repair protein RadA/Sms